jgi:hypothetical protein
MVDVQNENAVQVTSGIMQGVYQLGKSEKNKIAGNFKSQGKPGKYQRILCIIIILFDLQG